MEGAPEGLLLSPPGEELLASGYKITKEVDFMEKKLEMDDIPVIFWC